MLLLIKWFIMTLSVMVASYIIPGVNVKGFFTAMWVALFIGIVNVLVKPFLIFITLPINILTLGLFTFVINALLIMLASSVIKGFEVKGFWIAMLFSVVLSVINFIFGHVLGAK
ncbi:MAG TPA: phage holin family protein [Syntrophorhabdaceae bacterium]|nr:phage holin family protein [Syntrophorhabdaceae bacterium]HOS04563.1 phage holin family protein [Syntrophorhabdaceae bacterium]HPL40089.1 phage holin family protein [Syntrophorhabdaceae bacterium]HQP50734.1 phage holin family protein [Syntrophorhabdaceae bacterium]